MRNLVALCVPLLAFWMLVQLAAGNWMYLGLVGVSPLDHPPQLGEMSTQLEADENGEADSPHVAHTVCSSLPGLEAQQIEVCKTHPDTIRSVSVGAGRGIKECQYQFRNERWNCTTTQNKDRVFGYIMQRGSKETAFIYAVTSAGVVHAVTQACSSGNLTECSCDSSKQGLSTPEGWRWGGCSDNLDFGVQFARKFVDAPERGISRKLSIIRSKMNLHNNEAGREVITSLMRMQCRCHGVSGSCELKTCWQTMPSFNEVGDTLKKKYHLAIQIAAKKKKPRIRRKSNPKRPVPKGALIHIHKSPNYCIEDREKGIPGTYGRICNKTSKGPDGCNLLCCGRGYNTQVVKHVERCHCKFVWCCYVKCKTCVTLMDRHTCK